MVTKHSLRSLCQENLDNSPRNSFTGHLTSEQDDGVMGTGGLDGPLSVSSDRSTDILLVSDGRVCPRIMPEDVVGKSVACG